MRKLAALIAHGINLSFNSGSANITHYELVITRNGQEMAYNKVFEAGQIEYSISSTSSKSFYTPNVEFEASVRAVSDSGSSRGSSDTFTSPGRKISVV